MGDVQHATTVLDNEWRKDGDMAAYCLRIPDTGDRENPLTLSNPLGRLPVGVQTIIRNKDINVFVSSVSSTSLTLRFTANNGDVTLRVW
jgi:hypothetical protein